jgi:8-oxo-dGTP diphosphatase
VIDSPRNPRHSAAPKVAAGALFVDEQDRIMLVRPTYKPYWDVPGGYVEEGESPLQACAREVAEELGLVVGILGLLAVDWAPHPDEGDKMLFLFDGGKLTAKQLETVEFRDGEIQEFKFVDEAMLDDLTIPRLARRLRAAMQARHQMRPAYLEQGESPAGHRVL